MKPLVVFKDIDMRREGRISASRLKLWQECPRKYYYTNVATPEGAREPRNLKALGYGKRVHSALEDRVRGQLRLVPDAEPVEALAANMFASAGPMINPRAEERFALLAAPDVWIYGFIDVLETGRVTDWKTSSDPDTWALSTSALREDPQAILYGYVGQNEDGCLVRFIYGSTAPGYGSYVIERSVFFTPEELDAGLARLVAEGRVINEALADGTSDAFPHNARSCGKWGGCPFAEVCDVSDIDLMLALPV